MKTETNKMSAAELKEQGNRLYGARKFDEAIGYYSKAIVSFSFFFSAVKIFRPRKMYALGIS